MLSQFNGFVVLLCCVTVQGDTVSNPFSAPTDVPPITESQTLEMQGIDVVGIAMVENDACAVIRLANNELILLRVGDQVARSTVESISKDKVTLRLDDRVMTLLIGN